MNRTARQCTYSCPYNTQFPKIVVGLSQTNLKKLSNVFYCGDRHYFINVPGELNNIHHQSNQLILYLTYYSRVVLSTLLGLLTRDRPTSVIGPPG